RLPPYDIAIEIAQPGEMRRGGRRIDIVVAGIAAEECGAPWPDMRVAEALRRIEPVDQADMRQNWRQVFEIDVALGRHGPPARVAQPDVEERHMNGVIEMPEERMRCRAHPRFLPPMF